MKKIFLIILAGAFVLGLNAQELSKFEPSEKPQAAFFEFSVPIFGGAGAAIDFETGKVRVCPGFSFRRCATVTIRFFGSSEQLQYISSEVVVDNQCGNAARILSVCETDLDVLQIVESELLQLNDFDRVLRTSTIIMFDGN